MNLMKLDVLVIVLLCMYTLCYGGRDPYGTGGVRRRCYVYIILGGRDPYGTGGVRRRCYISYWEEGTRMARAECEDGAIIIASLQMIENEWLCVIQMCACVCDTRGMLDVLSYMIMKTSEYKFS